MAAVQPAGPDPMMTIFSCMLLMKVSWAGNITNASLSGRPNGCDAPPGLTVPSRRTLAALPVAGQDAPHCRTHFLRIPPDELVGADGAGDGAFGVLAQREAGNAQRRRLLLNAA